MHLDYAHYITPRTTHLLHYHYQSTQRIKSNQEMAILRQVFYSVK